MHERVSRNSVASEGEKKLYHVTYLCSVRSASLAVSAKVKKNVTSHEK